ncbi:MAG TPA: class I SAM-dependent methyltransferase [Acidimicrobiales bacterium]|jgi:ubiquinone/menaquinone biosynthesis C-methylase UbiE
MSWLFARVYDRLTAQMEEACLERWRADLLAGVEGDVLEIGAGTGRNLAHYGAGVRRLVLTEPDRHMRERLAERVAAEPPAAGRVEVVDAPAEHLPFPDGGFDVAVTTLVLCSVADQPAALAELRRVLRPGGRLVFLEHVAADGRPRRLRWQRRLEPVWRRLAGGCRLTRRTGDAIAAAGFEVEDVARESIRRASPLVRPSVRGTARVPAP